MKIISFCLFFFLFIETITCLVVVKGEDLDFKKRPSIQVVVAVYMKYILACWLIGGQREKRNIKV